LLREGVKEIASCCGYEQNGAQLLKVFMDQTASQSERKKIIVMQDHPIPDSIIPKGDAFEFFDAQEVARQLCIYEQSIFTAKYIQKSCWTLIGKKKTKLSCLQTLHI